MCHYFMNHITNHISSQDPSETHRQEENLSWRCLWTWIQIAIKSTPTSPVPLTRRTFDLSLPPSRTSFCNWIWRSTTWFKGYSWIWSSTTWIKESSWILRSTTWFKDSSRQQLDFYCNLLQQLQPETRARSHSTNFFSMTGCLPLRWNPTTHNGSWRLHLQSISINGWFISNGFQLLTTAFCFKWASLILSTGCVMMMNNTVPFWGKMILV